MQRRRRTLWNWAWYLSPDYGVVDLHHLGKSVPYHRRGLLCYQRHIRVIDEGICIDEREDIFCCVVLRCVILRIALLTEYPLRFAAFLEHILFARKLNLIRFE